jgi:hypothetical protein
METSTRVSKILQITCRTSDETNNVEITMGHDIGLSESYYKRTEQEVMRDYLKAVDNVTINGDKTVLKKTS